MSRNSWLIASENVVLHNSCYLATGTQRILMLFKVFYQGKKHVTRPIRIKLVEFFLLPQEALDDCADSIPGTLSVARCTCFPHHRISTDSSLERKQRLHSEAVLELAGRAVSVEEPCSRGDASSFEMVGQGIISWRADLFHITSSNSVLLPGFTAYIMTPNECLV